MSIHLTYFVHGSTIDNENKIASGWNDPSLSELGKQQIFNLKNQIKGRQFDYVFCSDLKRAVESANLLFSGINLLIDNRLREMNYGQFSGIISNLELESKIHFFINEKFFSGESLLDVENRMQNFMNFLKQNYNNNNIAILSHRFPQLALNRIIYKTSWIDELNNDWRKKGLWQPGWNYEIEVED